VFAAGIALAMLVTGCTSRDSAEAPDDRALDPDEGAATSDEVAASADEGVVPRVVVEELPLDPAEAAGFELPEEQFDLEGLDAFRLDFHAVGTLEPLGAEPQPALYRTRGSDLTSWMPVDLPIPDVYVRGGLSTVDHPGWVACVQDRDGHVWVDRDGDLLRVSPDGDVESVASPAAGSGPADCGVREGA